MHYLKEECVYIQYHPPAERNDLLKLKLNSSDCIILIDATMVQSPGPSHTEILKILMNKVHVIGAASAGALRASELKCFGMEGVGAIYESLILGKLTDDGELVVAMSPETYGALTIPLINIRRLIKLMDVRLHLSNHLMARLFRRAALIPYYERDWLALIESWSSEVRSIPKLIADKLLRIEDCDVKGLDAIRAIEKGKVRVGIKERSTSPSNSIGVNDLYWD